MSERDFNAAVKLQGELNFLAEENKQNNQRLKVIDASIEESMYSKVKVRMEITSNECRMEELGRKLGLSSGVVEGVKNV